MAGEVPALTSFTCGSCGAAVAIHAAGLTVTAVCSACGAISDQDNGTFKLIRDGLNKQTLKPWIPLGTKGKIRGQVYQVIGYMRRFDTEYPSEPWDEYLLFNPFLGYCWLVVSDGHWSLVKTTKSTPKVVSAHELSFLGDKYKVYHIGQAAIQYVVGEFYWRVRTGSIVQTTDAICPPHMLSKEEDKTEVVWSLSDYIPVEEVKAAFHPDPLPTPFGVAPNQPAPIQGVDECWTVWLLFVIALFVVQLFSNSTKHQVPIPGVRMTIPSTGLTDLEVAKFTTEHSSTAVAIHVAASVSQNWTSVGLRIVPDDPNGTAHEFEKDISFYSGSDGGEYWSEGSQTEDFLVNSLPQGGYRILLTAASQPGASIVIQADVMMAPHVWSNFWLALFIITIPTAAMSLRTRSFERHRWYNSEFNPFAKSGDS